MADDILRSLLGSEAAGRVLDVATGRGDFLARVLENLKPTIWPGINVGLDHAPAVLKAFKTAQTKAQPVQAPAVTATSCPRSTTASRCSLFNLSKAFRTLRILGSVMDYPALKLD